MFIMYLDPRTSLQIFSKIINVHMLKNHSCYLLQYSSPKFIMKKFKHTVTFKEQYSDCQDTYSYSYQLLAFSHICFI